MSRVAKMPIPIPSGVEVNISEQIIDFKGPKGHGELEINNFVTVTHEHGILSFEAKKNSVVARSMAGTSRALSNNLVKGVSEGHERKLRLVGVGYRAQMGGNDLTLSLGYSHPIVFNVPNGIAIETPSQTEIIVKGVDKQLVGKIAAEIRSFRPPEPYKGKGVRYDDEKIIQKEVKKK